MEINQPKSVKPKTGLRESRSGVKWQWALQREGFKQSGQAVLLSTPSFSGRSVSFRSPHHYPEGTFPLPHNRYIPNPSHPPTFDHPNNIR